jgi:hypothetical protein
VRAPSSLAQRRGGKAGYTAAGTTGGGPNGGDRAAGLLAGGGSGGINERERKTGCALKISHPRQGATRKYSDRE